jgi:CRP-like cAMP-binding protein
MSPSYERGADPGSTLPTLHGSAAQDNVRRTSSDAQTPAYRPNPLVSKLHGLSALSDDERVVLAGLTGASRAVDAGTDLSRDNDAKDGVLVLTAGFACRYKLRSNGARQITDYLVPGDTCDLRALPGLPRGSIATIAPSKVARISSESLTSAQQDYPAIGEAFRKAAVVEGSILREWLMNMGRRSAEERLAHLFCELLSRMQAVGLVHGNSFRLPLTQFDLGDTMGLSYVHVNRTLQTLRQQGLFTFGSKTLTVLNLDGLQTLAGFEPGYLR